MTTREYFENDALLCFMYADMYLSPHTGVTVGQCAKWLGCSKPTAKKRLRTLEKQGFIISAKVLNRVEFQLKTGVYTQFLEGTAWSERMHNSKNIFIRYMKKDTREYLEAIENANN